MFHIFSMPYKSDEEVDLLIEQGLDLIEPAADMGFGDMVFREKGVFERGTCERDLIHQI